MTKTILKEGDTCWRKVRCDRVAFIVDAAEYFAAAKEAILKAERCIYLIGWEFDLKIRLRPEVADPDIPDQLRLFLQYAVKNRPDLEIFILQWRGAMLFNIARQLGSYLLLKAEAKPRIHFRLDGEHPPGACHHQKIVVIDDILAFCGGIDMTSGRWDTSAHLSNALRGENDDHPMPWHDMTLALEGDAARSLGELARWRWRNATGHELPIPPRRKSLWPDKLSPDMADAVVGIARTSPAFGDNPEIHEVEKLWCAAIRSAKRTIYIENQFLSSGKLAHALKAQLEKEDGPEVVIILPFSAESWLESEAMDTRRSLILSDLRRADRNGRLGVYHPLNGEGRHIYVHAKLLIVDDNFVRVGSSNMSSRSMGFDTECDLALEAADQPELRKVVAGLRTKLIAEHLGISTQAAETEFQECNGSILAVIERFRTKHGRTLQVLETRELNATEKALAESRLLDPEKSIRLTRRLSDFTKKEIQHNRVFVTVSGLIIAVWSVRKILFQR